MKFARMSGLSIIPNRFYESLKLKIEYVIMNYACFRKSGHIYPVMHSHSIIMVTTVYKRK